LRSTDEEIVHKHRDAFIAIHFDQTILTSAFECIYTNNYSGAVALIELGLAKTATRPDKSSHHIKMRLDTLRILGLMICTDQSKLLI
jgi:hypothetical protein